MNRGQARLLVALVLSAHALGDEPALGHGPCGCLTPASGPPGTTVSGGAGAYKVVFNPDRTDLLIGPKSLWRQHRPGHTPSVVYRKTYSYSDLPLTGPVDFRVPSVRPGRYLVSIYDGSEGGAHYTWEYFRVTERQAEDAAPEASDQAPPVISGDTGVPVLTAVIAGVAGLLLGLLVGGSAARRWPRISLFKFRRPSG